MQKWLWGLLGLSLTIFLGWSIVLGWLFLGGAASKELEGEEAIAQVRYATDTSLEDTQTAVSEAHFLVTTGGIDGTAFYQFRATKAYMEAFIDRTQLKVSQASSSQCQTLTNQAPRRSWWTPEDYPSSQCYEGYYDGAFYYLLYDAGSGIAFLKINDS